MQTQNELLPDVSLVDPKKLELLEQQISDISEQHDLQLREYPIEVLIRKYEDGLEDDQAEIFIPDYQREFIWRPTQQSRFIESLFLNLPIPPLFVGDTDAPERRGALEVIDGTQRIRTLSFFMNDKLTLCGLKKISALNGLSYGMLPRHWQRRFKTKALRVAVMTVKLDEEARREMFDRLNSGGTKLQPMEQRRGANDGPFLKLLEELAKDPIFISICPLPEKKIKLREAEEMLLRFFAYLEKHQEFQHEVDPFLTTYLVEKNKELIGPDGTAHATRLREEFHRTMNFISHYFPGGFRKDPRYNTVPRVRFEAIGVGTALALRKNSSLIPNEPVTTWLESNEFKIHTRSDATNSRPKLFERLWFVRDKLLGLDPQKAPRRAADDEWKNLSLI